MQDLFRRVQLVRVRAARAASHAMYRDALCAMYRCGTCLAGFRGRRDSDGAGDGEGGLPAVGRRAADERRARA